MRRQLFRVIMAMSLVVALLSPALALTVEKAKVDLNEADSTQLESLPGIGPAMAARILEYREKNGPFKQIEDLLNVRGIGEKKFEQLKELIKVRPSQPDQVPAKN